LESNPKVIMDLTTTGEKTEVRRLFASLIGASSDDIAIMASTAFAISLAGSKYRSYEEGWG
jgi:selenocysteine lyase/cysteine desulfurase